MRWECDALKADLQALVDFAATVYPYNQGSYGANPPLSASEIESFERKHQIALPEEYRFFLSDVGNGGRWPWLLHERLGTGDPWLWLGDPAAPFPHAYRWNEPAGEPRYSDEVDGDPEYEAQLKQWTDRYFNKALLNGAIPLHDSGCGRAIWLVVSGPRAGTIWFDARIDREGIFPLINHDGMRFTFLYWFRVRISDAVNYVRSELHTRPQPSREAAADLGRWTRTDESTKESHDLEVTKDRLILRVRRGDHWEHAAFHQPHHGLCNDGTETYLLVQFPEGVVALPCRLVEDCLVITDLDGAVQGRSIAGTWRRPSQA